MMQFGVQSSMLDTQITITLSVDAVSEITLAWCLFGKLHLSSLFSRADTIAIAGQFQYNTGSYLTGSFGSVVQQNWTLEDSFIINIIIF